MKLNKEDCVAEQKAAEIMEEAQRKFFFHLENFKKSLSELQFKILLLEKKVPLNLEEYHSSSKKYKEFFEDVQKFIPKWSEKEIMKRYPEKETILSNYLNKKTKRDEEEEEEEQENEEEPKEEEPKEDEEEKERKRQEEIKKNKKSWLKNFLNRRKEEKEERERKEEEQKKKNAENFLKIHGRKGKKKK